MIDNIPMEISRQRRWTYDRGIITGTVSHGYGGQKFSSRLDINVYNFLSLSLSLSLSQSSLLPVDILNLKMRVDIWKK